MKKSKRKNKVSKELKEANLSALKEFSSTYICNYNPSEIDLVTNTAWCKKITSSNCWRPDIFLDNDRSCGDCKLYDNCDCSLKNKKRKQNKI
jgi:hypothetical protein